MHKWISKHQDGFLSRHSTVSNLLESVSDWTLALNNGQSVTVAYVNYAKEFDVVCHNKLLSKLSAYGITGDLTEWIRNFLSERSGHGVPEMTDNVSISSGNVAY